MVCKDRKDNVMASIPVDYVKGEYALEKIYYPSRRTQYEIAYNQKEKQGWGRKYDETGKVITEMYFDHGKMAESSRSYYPNGRVKELLTISNNSPRKIVSRYGEDGTLEFSLTYNNKGERQEAYLLYKEQNKDILVRYYKGEADSIRESNLENPYNFIEYNISLGEYAVHKDNVLVKAGKLCNYQQPTDVVVVRAQNDEGVMQPETAEESLQKAQSKEQILLEKNSALAVLQQLADENLSDAASRKNQNIKEEVLEPIKEKDIKDFDKSVNTNYKFENAVIPTAEEKQQAELAKKNMGPVAKPDIENLVDVVQKKTIETPISSPEVASEPKTERIYYPNGNLRKTIKTQGSRTEEIKEYSKNGLLLTDTTYNQDKIVIEKYFGSGQVRRKTEKLYDDNAVNAFLSREDFYDTGKPRYEIRRKPDTMLFIEKVYNSDGKLKTQTEQKSALAFVTKEYNKDEQVQTETETLGNNLLTKEYNEKGLLVKMSVNGKEVPISLAKNSSELLKDNAKTYNKGLLTSAFKTEKNHNDMVEYYSNGNIKTEIVFYNNGEISVKSYSANGNLQKFAYLAPDGKLHIEKPKLQIVPAYRERYWVDYNNPYWVENQDKYSIKSIARLNLDVAAYILAELDINVPDIMKKLYEYY